MPPFTKTEKTNPKKASEPKPIKPSKKTTAKTNASKKASASEKDIPFMKYAAIGFSLLIVFYAMYDNFLA